jgi:thiamine biosynthesis lipoprotein
MKAILRVLFLLLIALGLAKVILTGDSGRPWEGKYVPRSARVTEWEDGVRVVRAYEGVMGTVFVAELEAPDRATAERAERALWRRIWDLERKLSTWIPTSQLSRVNRDAAGEPVRVDADVMSVLETAGSTWSASNGAFDPTVGPLLRVWKPLAVLKELPAPEEVAAAKALVGFGQVRLLTKERAVSFLRPGITLDVGGIGKGYAAEQAVRAALDAGAVACRVNAGGDMFAGGAPRGSPKGHPVTIRDPDGPPDATLPGISFPVLNAGVATSGNYERYTEIAGKRYSHILDPRTGRPVPDAVVQVTVVSNDGAEADALATALTVLGVDRGLALLRGYKYAYALFITREDGKLVLHPSPGFEAIVR